MRSKKKILYLLIVVLAVMFIGHHNLASFLFPVVFAHCDTMDGPVITTAQKALDTGNLNLVLPWIQEKDEVEIKKVFDKTLAVRKLGPEAKELADMHFFETLVRIHRAGEGASYTGIKPAGSEVEPSITATDKALENGSVDNLVKEMNKHIGDGIRERFNNAIEKKKHKDETVEAGREYVEAYVTFIHYVEKLYADASSQSAHHDESGNTELEGHHKK